MPAPFHLPPQASEANGQAVWYTYPCCAASTSFQHSQGALKVHLLPNSNCQCSSAEIFRQMIYLAGLQGVLHLAPGEHKRLLAAAAAAGAGKGYKADGRCVKN